jgi:Family of unknown function (DUF6527)
MSERQTPASRTRWRGSVATRDEARSLLQEAGDVVLVERGRPRSVIIKCPCGCGEELVINLDERVGPAWHLYRDERGLTLYPSVWRESGCRSHFVIWHDALFLCEGDWRVDEPTDPHFEERVLAHLPKDQLRSFEETAFSIGAIPWSVLAACRELARRGLVREGMGRFRGCFQRCSV